MLKTFKEFSSENQQKSNLLNKLVDLAWNRYEPETKDFFDKLSKKDPEIRSIFEQIENADTAEPDVIAKNIADSEFGNEDI